MEMFYGKDKLCDIEFRLVLWKSDLTSQMKRKITTGTVI